MFVSQNVRVGLSAEATETLCLHCTDGDGKLSEVCYLMLSKTDTGCNMAQLLSCSAGRWSCALRPSKQKVMDWGRVTSYQALHNKEMWSLTRSLRLSTFAKQMVFPNAKASCGELAFQPQLLQRAPTAVERGHFRLLIKPSLQSLPWYKKTSLPVFIYCMCCPKVPAIFSWSIFAVRVTKWWLGVVISSPGSWGVANSP